jgi:hypothetical protein
MDTTFRGWELIRAAGEGGQTACSNDRCQTTTEDDVTSREDQDDHKNEEFTSRGEGSTSAKDGTTGSIGAPTRKGGAAGHRDRRNKAENRVDRLGRGTTTTKLSCTGGKHSRKEQLGLGAVPENNGNV